MEEFSLFQAISDYGLAIVATIGAGVAACKLLHFLLKDVIASLKSQDIIIVDLIDKSTRLEIIIQRMDSKLDTVLKQSSEPLLKDPKERYRV